MSTLFAWLERLLVVAAVVAALGYALLALTPDAVKRRVALALGARAPAWLARRLAPHGGCGACPANAMNGPRGAKPR